MHIRVSSNTFYLYYKKHKYIRYIFGGSKMRSKKMLTLGVILLFGISMLSVRNFFLTTADSFPPPALNMVAPYRGGILLDGYNWDWDITNERLFNITDKEDDLNYLEVTINFAHNDTHLFFYMYIPVYRGHVKGADLHFFGNGHDDGVHMAAIYDYYHDLAYGDASGPQLDTNIGGYENVIAYLNYTNSYGTWFEGAKELRSGDSAGKDIWLNLGDPIAVDIQAWIGIYPDSGEPNYVSKPNYIRVDIDHYAGKTLESDLSEPSQGLDWIEGRGFEAPYIESAVIIDGVADETAWTDAMKYDITLSFLNWSSKYWDPANTIDVKFIVFHNGLNFYFYLELYDEVETETDFVGYVIGDGIDMLNLSDGTDFVMLGNGYGDGFLPEDYSEPIADDEVGGMINGESNVTYSGNYRKVEFCKPLEPNDPLGRDWNFVVGQYLYIHILVAQNSYEGGPNYFDLEDIDGKPHFVVHPIKLLNLGEEPTGNNNGNTFTLGFDVSSLLIIVAVLSPVMAIVYLRRKK